MALIIRPKAESLAEPASHFATGCRQHVDITERKRASFPSLAEQPDTSIECRKSARRRVIEAVLQEYIWFSDPRYAVSSYGGRIDDSRANDRDLPFSILLSRTLLCMVVNAKPERPSVHNDRGQPLPHVAPLELVAPIVRGKRGRAAYAPHDDGDRANRAHAVGKILTLIRHVSATHADALEDHARDGVDLILVRNKRTDLDKKLNSRTASKRLGTMRADVVAERNRLNREEDEIEKRRRKNRHRTLYDRALHAFDVIAHRRRDVMVCIFGEEMAAA